MKFIHNTTSLCDISYQHVPSIVYEKDDKILMTKNCGKHGEVTSIVETDVEFYYNLKHYRDIEYYNQILFEASDRCQLNCPHCYHLPNNKIQDRSISSIIDQLKLFPKDSFPMLAGAEATLRPDFVKLCNEINKLNFKKFELLSNGLKFADKKFTKECYDAGLTTMCLGLNHPSYQGERIHNKQIKALYNLIDLGYEIGYVGYTVESYDHLPFILNEIKQIHCSNINHYRIRCGSFIGRSSDKQRGFLSVLISKIKELIGKEIISYKSDDNPYHVMLEWNNILLRVIQWPDVTNIDMEELATGPWCQFYNGPITNFVHQVITRDAYKNLGLPQVDIIPKKYQYRSMVISNFKYWKDDWKGPQEFKKFDWSSNNFEQTIGVI